MTLSAIHNFALCTTTEKIVVCDIGGYDFVSYSQQRDKVLDFKAGCL